MYNIIISILIATAVAILAMFLPWMGWVLASIIGLVAFMGSMIFLTRRIMKKIEPEFILAQKQAQNRQFQLAVKTLEELKPYAQWQIMLKGQIFAQLGIIYYAQKDEENALVHLQQAHPKVTDARLILAAIYFRKKDAEKVKEVMEVTVKANKKQMIIYNAYAYMLDKLNQKDYAIQILQKGLKIEENNEASKDNLMRLQNNKKMNMKPFGMTWYSLQLERPPMSMMQDQFAGMSGFRQKRKKVRM